MKKSLLSVLLALVLAVCVIVSVSCGSTTDKCDNHEFGDWYETTPATCTTDGEKRRDCKNCDYYQTEVSPAGHVYGDWTVVTPAGCETSGSKQRNCVNCDNHEEETVASLGHDYSVEVSYSDSTCGKAGSQTLRCSRCDSTKTNVIPATEQHNYVDGVCATCGGQKASEGLSIRVKEDHCEVYGIGSCKDTDIVIPATYQGLPVTSIDQGAFEGNKNIRTLVISDNLTNIGMQAFSQCTGLTKITFGNGLKTIYGLAFEYCSALTEIVIPDSVTSISNGAFSQCRNLVRVKIGDGVTYIDMNAFANCNYLETVILGKNVSSINYLAFAQSNSIKYNIYDNAKYLGTEENPYMWLWRVNQGATSCTIHPDTKYIISEIGLNFLNVADVVIPDGVITIDRYVFTNNAVLTEIVIPDSVTSIGWMAFDNCSSLESIVIGSGVESIAYQAFYGCKSLKKVYYKGSINDWRDIDIAKDNSALSFDIRYYYSDTNPYESNPDDIYQYWHYDTDGETILIWKK